MLWKFRANKLHANVDKCELCVDTTNTLGFIISPGCLQMADAKVQVVRSCHNQRKLRKYSCSWLR